MQEDLSRPEPRISASAAPCALSRAHVPVSHDCLFCLSWDHIWLCSGCTPGKFGEPYMLLGIKPRLTSAVAAVMSLLPCFMTVLCKLSLEIVMAVTLLIPILGFSKVFYAVGFIFHHSPKEIIVSLCLFNVWPFF